jgi:hypothetical protein
MSSCVWSELKGQSEERPIEHIYIYIGQGGAFDCPFSASSTPQDDEEEATASIIYKHIDRYKQTHARKRRGSAS